MSRVVILHSLISTVRHPPEVLGTPSISGHYNAVQSSTRRPSICENSRVLLVTRITSNACAWLPMSESSGPIGLPRRSSDARAFPYLIAAASSNAATSRANKNSPRASCASLDRLLFAAPNASSPRTIDEIPTWPIDLPRSFLSAAGCFFMMAIHVFVSSIHFTTANPASLPHSAARGHP